jgi:hypothetical protein
VQLLEAYQRALPGQQSFHCRLIELVAVAVHRIAAYLFKQGHRIHDTEAEDPAYAIGAVTSWYPPWYLKGEAGPTLFMHFCYGAVDLYPDGLADAVGYWAESRVLGGVVIFDRSEAWHDDGRPEPNVYLHSDRKYSTFRVWQALDEQQQSLVNFLLSSPGGHPPCPLPLCATAENLKRFDPDTATRKKVYGGVWERGPPTGEYNHCRKSRLDYPERFL